MEDRGERLDRFGRWAVTLLVISTLTIVVSLPARLIIGFVLASLGVPPALIEVTLWIVDAAVLVAVILGWRSMQRAAREEERRGR